jgi:hypothetical protein
MAHGVLSHRAASRRSASDLLIARRGGEGWCAAASKRSYRDVLRCRTTRVAPDTLKQLRCGATSYCYRTVWPHSYLWVICRGEEFLVKFLITNSYLSVAMATRCRMEAELHRTSLEVHISHSSGPKIQPWLTCKRRSHSTLMTPHGVFRIIWMAVRDEKLIYLCLALFECKWVKQTATFRQIILIVTFLSHVSEPKCFRIFSLSDNYNWIIDYYINQPTNHLPIRTGPAWWVIVRSPYVQSIGRPVPQYCGH